ncbi:MAG: extracellular solute-binding protein [Pseudomonadota bacterium]|nr:extracellular solute-binding protein [Pseudomonadota bacterium]
MQMGRTIGTYLLVLALAPSAGAASFDPALEAAARREGNVVWYTGLIVNQITRPMAAAFEARFPGIRVRYSRASNTETTLKLLNEARANRVQADVFDVTSGIHSLLEAHVAASFQPSSAKHYPAILKDPEGYWFGTNLYFLTVAYNTNLIKQAEAPRTWDDLLDPKWKGHMAWTSELAAQGPPGFIFNALTLKGPDKGMDYLRRFATQEPVSIASSPRAVLDQVVSGEQWIGVMMYNHHAAISAAAGAPVAWVKMQPLVGLFSIMGIMKDAPHPNAARLFEAYVLSPEGQAVFAANDYLPADPDVPAQIPELKPEAGHFSVNYITPEMTRDDLPKWIAIYHEVFR